MPTINRGGAHSYPLQPENKKEVRPRTAPKEYVPQEDQPSVVIAKLPTKKLNVSTTKVGVKRRKKN